MSFISKISRIFRKTDEQEGDAPEETPVAKYDIDVRDYINKFVKQNATDIGESVTVHDDRLIVKNKDGFMAISLDAVEDNSENIVVGDFDVEVALQMGKEWSDMRDTLKFDEKGMMIQEEAKE